MRPWSDKPIRILGEDHLQAALIDVRSQTNIQTVLKIFFRDIKSAKTFFEGGINQGVRHYVEVFGLMENVPVYPSRLQDRNTERQSSLGLKAAVLRVEVL